MTNRGRSVVDGAAVAAVATVPAVVEWWAGEIHAGADLATLFVPNWSWWGAGGGADAGWNPWIFAGYPAAADPLLSRLHPLALLYVFLSPLRAARVEGVLLTALAAVGMLLYLRACGCGRTGRWLGAVVFAFGGFTAAHAVHPPILRSTVVVPWALWAIEVFEGRGLAAAVAVAVSLVLAGGHPQSIVLAGGLVAVAALWRGRPFQARRLAWLGVGLVVGVGLAAPVWLPALEWIPATTRADATPAFPNPRLLRADWYRLIAPFGAWWRADPPFACGRIECGAYPGMVAWIVLIGAVTRLVSDRAARFWVAVALAGGVAATGIVSLPAGVRAPARFLLWWNTAAAVLVALGADALAAHPRRRCRLAGAAVATGVVLVGLWRLAPGPSPAMAVAVALLAAGAVALLLDPPRADRFSVLPVALLTAELLVFTVLIVPAGAPPETIDQLLRPLRMVAPHTGGRPETASLPTQRVLFLPHIPGSNWASHVGVPLVQGYNLLVSRRLATLLGQRTDLALESIGVVSDPTLAARDNRVLDLLRVGLVARDPTRPNPLGDAIARAAEQPGGRWRRIPGPGAGDWELYANARPAPVAWLVSRARIAPDAEAQAAIRGTGAGPSFDPAWEAFVSVPVPSDPADEVVVPAVDVIRYTPGRVALRTSASRPSLLVTSELFVPGWTATVDGESVPIVPVNTAFLGLPVSAGPHEVVLTYAPASLWWGNLVAASCVLVLGALVGLRRRTAEHARAAGAVRPR